MALPIDLRNQAWNPIRRNRHREKSVWPPIPWRSGDNTPGLIRVLSFTIEMGVVPFMVFGKPTSEIS